MPVFRTTVTSALLALFVSVSAGFAQTTSAPSTETGLAAVYSSVLHGRRTASGQVYDQNKLTAAHKTLPYGTTIRVTNPKNGKTVDLRVTDRGPTQAGRILDISRAAARALGIHPRVMREVTLEVVEMGDGKTFRRR